MNKVVFNAKDQLYWNFISLLMTKNENCYHLVILFHSSKRLWQENRIISRYKILIGHTNIVDCSASDIYLPLHQCCTKVSNV